MRSTINMVPYSFYSFCTSQHHALVSFVLNKGSSGGRSGGGGGGGGNHHFFVEHPIISVCRVKSIHKVRQSVA